VALDVTEANLAGSALPPGEEPFRLALRGSPIIVYRQDSELRHTWIYNPQHGLPIEAVLGKTDADFLLPEEAAFQAAIKRRVMETGVGERVEVRVTVEGEVAFYDLTVEPLRDRSGTIVGITGAATNVTALRQAQAALAQREAQLAEAQRLAQVGSWEWDIAQDRVVWSKELYRIWGLRSEDGPLTHEDILGHVHPDDRAFVNEVIDTASRAGEPYICDHRIIRPDGEVRHLQSRGSVVLDEAGRRIRMHGTGQDITELRRAEEEQAAHREQQARLDGMLFAARQLADRMTVDLARSTGAIDLLGAQPDLTPELHAVIDAAAAGLAAAAGGVVELQRLVPTPLREESGGPAREPGQPRTEP
jgi:PAS domain S-box-containing protein